jgi:hypothetical protein
MKINEFESRLNLQGSFYIFHGALETNKLGMVQVYMLENMKSDQECQRMEIIKKVL